MRTSRAFTVKGREDLRVAVAGGGTGGHVFPAVAVAEAVRVRDPSSRVLFIGAKGRIEEGFLDRQRFECAFLSSPRMNGAASLPFFGARFAASLATAWRVLARFRPHVLVGSGGYASVAPALAARALGARVILLEQNAIPGRANRFLARFADEVHTQFAESVARFPAGARVRVTGNPVRAAVLDSARKRRYRRGNGPFTLLVMGGSQGARSLNHALWDALPRLGAAFPTMRVYHCAGARDNDRARARLFASGLAGRTWGFCRIIHELYACADLAVARAGATSIAELAAAGLPTVLVPYPHARDDHQNANAALLRRAGACEVVDDGSLNGPTLAEPVVRLARDPAARARMSRACLEFARPDAADTVARRVEALAGFARPVEIAPAAEMRAA